MRYPNVLCGQCRLTIFQYAKGKTKINVSDVLNKLTPLPKETRKTYNSKRTCIVCKIAISVHPKLTSKSFKPVNARRKKSGRPKSFNKSSEDYSMKICKRCLNVLDRGKRQCCSKSTRQLNLKIFVEEGSTKSKEQLASSIIKQK